MPEESKKIVLLYLIIKKKKSAQSEVRFSSFTELRLHFQVWPKAKDLLLHTILNICAYRVLLHDSEGYLHLRLSTRMVSSLAS